MGLLSVKTTAMSSTVLCARSLSSSVPAGSALTAPFDAMVMRTARINRMRRTVKVLRIPLCLVDSSLNQVIEHPGFFCFVFVLAFGSDLSFVFDYAMHIMYVANYLNHFICVNSVQINVFILLLY